MRRIYTPREIVKNRQPSGKRPIAIGRQSISPPHNGKLNVILDTNILVSALLNIVNGFTNGASYRVVDELKKNSYNLIQPQDLIGEYKYELERLTEENFFKKEKIDELLNLMQSKGNSGRSYVMPNIEPIDEDDKQVFNTSFIGNVDYVVSQDLRHLVNKKIKGLPPGLKIVGPNTFLKILQKSKN